MMVKMIYMMMTIMMMILNDDDADQNQPGSVMTPSDPRKASITPYKSDQELLADLKGLVTLFVCLFSSKYFLFAFVNLYVCLLHTSTYRYGLHPCSGKEHSDQGTICHQIAS